MSVGYLGRSGKSVPLRNELAASSEWARSRMRRGSLTWSGVVVGGVILILGSKILSWVFSISTHLRVCFAAHSQFALYLIQSNPSLFFSCAV